MLTLHFFEHLRTFQNSAHNKKHGGRLVVFGRNWLRSSMLTDLSCELTVIAMSSHMILILKRLTYVKSI